MKEKNILSVRLGDLLKELSELTNVDINEFNVNLEFLPHYIYGAHEKSDVLHNGIKEKLVLSIVSNDIFFNYTMICDLTELQADDKTLYNHVKVIQKHTLEEKELKWDETYIILPKESLKNIICNFNLNDFKNSDLYSDEVIRAIIISANNQNKKENQKVLKKEAK